MVVADGDRFGHGYDHDRDHVNGHAPVSKILGLCKFTSITCFQ